MSRPSALVAIALVLGCRASSPKPDPDRVAIEEVVERVQFLRQLPRKRPIVVHLVEPATFRAALSHERVMDSDLRDRERAWLTAFSLAPADVDLGGVEDQQSDSVGATYDHRTKRIVVPRGARFDEDALGHEIAHALADQHFGIRYPVEDEAAAAYAGARRG